MKSMTIKTVEEWCDVARKYERSILDYYITLGNAYACLCKGGIIIRTQDEPLRYACVYFDPQRSQA